MVAKKISAVRNPRTGSYRVRVSKSAATGKFVRKAEAKGRIEVRGSAKNKS